MDRHNELFRSTHIVVYVLDHFNSVCKMQNKKLCLEKCQIPQHAFSINKKTTKKRQKQESICDLRTNNDSKFLSKVYLLAYNEDKDTDLHCSIEHDNYTFSDNSQNTKAIQNEIKCFQEWASLINMISNDDYEVIDISSMSIIDDVRLFNNIIDNHSIYEHQLSTISKQMNFIIPPNCSFVMGNLLTSNSRKTHYQAQRSFPNRNINVSGTACKKKKDIRVDSEDTSDCCLQYLVDANRTYSVIVMDPPWSSKSVSRSEAYETYSKKSILSIPSIIEALMLLPIRELADPNRGTLLGIWCTNNQTYFNAVQNDLFHSYGALPLSQLHTFRPKNDGIPASSSSSSPLHEADVIYWLKMACDGVPVHPLRYSEDGSCTSGERRPFERLLLAFIPPVSFSSTLTPACEIQTSLPRAMRSIEASTNTPSSQQDESCLKGDGALLPIYIFTSVPLRHSYKPMTLKFQDVLDHIAQTCQAVFNGGNENEEKEVESDDSNNSDICTNKNKNDVPHIDTLDSSTTRRLELFARELRPGWTSVGNEPILFQSTSWFHSFSTHVNE